MDAFAGWLGRCWNGIVTASVLASHAQRDRALRGGGLTFDMSGGRQPAKPDVARPLDGKVRCHSLEAEP